MILTFDAKLLSSKLLLRLIHKNFMSPKKKKEKGYFDPTVLVYICFKESVTQLQE